MEFDNNSFLLLVNQRAVCSVIMCIKEKPCRQIVGGCLAFFICSLLLLFPRLYLVLYTSAHTRTIAHTFSGHHYLPRPGTCRCCELSLEQLKMSKCVFLPARTLAFWQPPCICVCICVCVCPACAATQDGYSSSLLTDNKPI